MKHVWIPPFRRIGMPLLGAALLASCDTPQKHALRALDGTGIEASGRSLVEAVTARDEETIRLLLEAGVYTGQRDSAGFTPLAIAVDHRDFPAAVLLLNAGADVNASLANQTSILGIAAKHEDAVMLDLLLANGAHTGGLMPDGRKILPWAIREGHLGLMRTMMKADSDPHLKDLQGNPLLHIAMEAGRRELMESLIELGADPGATNAAGETTIELALKQGWIDIIPKLAAAGADPNARSPDGLTLLERAVATHNPGQAALFLKIGADPNLHSGPETSRSPLQTAFTDPDPAMFETFLRCGAKPPERHWDSWLWQAFRCRDREKARLLLSHGASLPPAGPDDFSLVETAALAGDASFVKLLLDYGLPAGRSIDLMCARGDAEMTGLLLACGVSPDFTRFPTCDTALANAIRGHHDNVASLLLRHGARSDLPIPEGQSLFQLAVATGCAQTVKHLLDAGTDPNAPFSLPASPEFLQDVRPGVMRWILKHDRNVFPIMVAADSGNVQIARYLVKAGARTEVRTRVAALWPINFASRRCDVRMMRLFLGRDPYHEERRIEIRLSEQRARVFDATGNEIFTTKVSTGRPGFDTPTGEYAITNKYREWKSTLYHASMPYFQRLNCGDFGMHLGNVPDHPASHGCIRLPADNAEKLYSLTKTGDRVRILP